MLYFLSLLDEVPEICSHPSLLQTIKFLYYLIKILGVLIPVALALTITVNTFKSIVISETENISKILNSIGNKLLLGVVFFLIPNIFITVVNLINSDTQISNCLTKSLEIDLKKYKEEYEIAKKAELAQGSNSGTDEDLFKLIQGFEGGQIFCDDAKTEYRAVNIGDGAGATVGYGITNATKNVAPEEHKHYYPLDVNECYKKEDMDAIFYSVVINNYQAPVIDEAKKQGITLSTSQIHALTSLSYQSGPSVARKAVQKYKENPSSFVRYYLNKSYATCSGTNKPVKWCGLIKRRDQELQLFFNGIYPTEYYSTNLKYENPAELRLCGC